MVSVETTRVCGYVVKPHRDTEADECCRVPVKCQERAEDQAGFIQGASPTDP